MKIRQMGENEIGFAAECTRKEGWMGETEDIFKAFLEFDARGCFVAEVDGAPVGMCVAIRYESCGFLGELIVLEEHRGRGFGRKLMEHSMAYLGDVGCSSIYLDGDEPATLLYEKLGFKHLCKSLRFVGKAPIGECENVGPMTESDFEEIAGIDRKAFGANRLSYLRNRFKLFPQLCKTMKVDERIVGYIMGQPGVGVTSVGPWVVTDELESPLDLLSSLQCEVEEDKLRIGVLESNTRAVFLFRSLTFLEEGTPSFRMVYGNETQLGISPQLFSIGAAAKG